MQKLKRARHKLLQKTAVIHDHYVAEGATAQVNISSTLRSEVWTILDQQMKMGRPDPLVEVLDRVQEELVSMISRGPFIRFLGSDLYADWRREDRAGVKAVTDFIRSYANRKSGQATSDDGEGETNDQRENGLIEAAMEAGVDDD